MAAMVPHTPAWKWVLGLVVMLIGLAISVPLARYAEQDDAPGGVVIALLIFVGAAVVAVRIVNQRAEHAPEDAHRH